VSLSGCARVSVFQKVIAIAKGDGIFAIRRFTKKYAFSIIAPPFPATCGKSDNNEVERDENSKRGDAADGPCRHSRPTAVP
jgi:hypothetical protein